MGRIGVDRLIYSPPLSGGLLLLIAGEVRDALLTRYTAGISDIFGHINDVFEELFRESNLGAVRM